MSTETQGALMPDTAKKALHIELTSQDRVDEVRGGALRTAQKRGLASQQALIGRLLEVGELSREEAVAFLQQQYTDLTYGNALDAVLKVEKALAE